MEAPTSLSRSRLWQLQRAYYERRATAAFADIPHQAVDNPFVAEAYARVVLGFLRDCARGGLEASEPLYVVELGAGAGRFAHGFVRELGARIEALPFALPPLVYVMTDLGRANARRLGGQSGAGGRAAGLRALRRRRRSHARAAPARARAGAAREPARRDRQLPVRQRAGGRVRGRRAHARGVPRGGRGRRRRDDGARLHAAPGCARPLRRPRPRRAARALPRESEPHRRDDPARRARVPRPAARARRRPPARARGRQGPHHRGGARPPLRAGAPPPRRRVLADGQLPRARLVRPPSRRRGARRRRPPRDDRRRRVPVRRPAGRLRGDAAGLRRRDRALQPRRPAGARRRASSVPPRSSRWPSSSRCCG